MENELRLVPELDAGLGDLQARLRRPTPHRRGWLMRRMLLGADVAALVVAYLMVQAVVDRGAHGRPIANLVVFVLALPGWATMPPGAAGRWLSLASAAIHSRSAPART